jgi:Xaa-Pro aminopeptidase
LSKRLEALRAVLAERELDAVLITHPNNRFYLSGYTGDDDPPNESAGVLVVSRDRAIILAPANNIGWAASEAKEFEATAWRRPWESSVAELTSELGIKKLGIEEDAILFSSVETLNQNLNGSIDLVGINDSVTNLRAVKEPAEIDLLQQALKLTDDVFVACTQNLSPGITERDLAWSIERTMREMGGDGPAFHTIVASGPHAARPHHSPSDRALSPGEPIIIDMGARIGGYNGDMTRTIWLGEPSSKLKDVYNAVFDALSSALSGIKAGLTGKEADAFARTVITEAGYGEYFTHGLGHGLGVRVHEAPSASASASNVLHAGEVLTVEPGIYIPGWGGVRLEDVVLIQENGARNMTTAPKHPRF